MSFLVTINIRCFSMLRKLNNFHYAESMQKLERNSPKGRVSAKLALVLSVISNSHQKGLNTREIADKCNMTVYSARNWLLKLEQNGIIQRKGGPKNILWHR